MIADRLGVSTVTVGFWLTPWIRQDEHLPMSHIAEVSHNRGFFWDGITVESSGGLNPLAIDGVPKSFGTPFRRLPARTNERGAANYAASFTASPLKVMPPLLAEIATFSPSLTLPDRISSASGSCTAF